MAYEEDDIDESPQDSDLEAFDSPTVTCPECGSELYDDVEICWKCGHALSGAGAVPKKWVLWVAGGLVLLFILGMLWWAR